MLQKLFLVKCVSMADKKYIQTHITSKITLEHYYLINNLVSRHSLSANCADHNRESILNVNNFEIYIQIFQIIQRLAVEVSLSAEEMNEILRNITVTDSTHIDYIDKIKLRYVSCQTIQMFSVTIVKQTFFMIKI